MKNKTIIMNEVKEGLVRQNAKSSNVILSYCTHSFIFFLNKP